MGSQVHHYKNRVGAGTGKVGGIRVSPHSGASRYLLIPSLR